MEHEYILGTDAEEAERLLFQHQTWLAHATSSWQRAGIGAGDVVLDLGCGPGFTTFELARVVTETGKVIARDMSGRFLDAIDNECAKNSISNIETSVGAAEDLALPAASLDAVYARWLFCWLADPQAVLQQTARALKPGGRMVIQDYVGWGAMTLLPPADWFDRVVKACLQSFEAAGGEINVCRLLPSFAREAGLRVVRAEPIARVGAVDSAEWRWLGEFLLSFLSTIVAEGCLTADEADEFRRGWTRRTEQGESHIFAPVMLDLQLTAMRGTNHH